MTLHTGENVVGGVAVRVVRKRTKNINLRIQTDGAVHLSVPVRATLAQGAAFLASKWAWVERTRERLRRRPPLRVCSPMEVARLQMLLADLHARWAVNVGAFGVAWKIRRMRTRWGVCNRAKRCITYAESLAVHPREVVEYIVCHEFCHFAVCGHGARFHALMDRRMPDWRARRRRLNRPEEGDGGAANIAT